MIRDNKKVYEIAKMLQEKVSLQLELYIRL